MFGNVIRAILQSNFQSHTKNTTFRAVEIFSAYVGECCLCDKKYLKFVKNKFLALYNVSKIFWNCSCDNCDNQAAYCVCWRKQNWFEWKKCHHDYNFNSQSMKAINVKASEIIVEHAVNAAWILNAKFMNNFAPEWGHTKRDLNSVSGQGGQVLM